MGGKLLNIVTPLHKAAKRDCIGRMCNEKVHCMEIAKRYDADYWDGDRKYGYGGYKYDGRWAVVAKALIDSYNLKQDARILDVGCGKAFLLYELKTLLPGVSVTGFDISAHALNDAKSEIRDNLFIHRAQEPYPFSDNEFDLVISLTTLHNLKVFDLKTALREIERVGREKYIVVESYRSEQELFNLQCWALTCESFFEASEWVWLFNEFGYSGDYEFIYF